MRQLGRNWRSRPAAIAALLAAGCVAAPQPAEPSRFAVPGNQQCRMADEDRNWLAAALGSWGTVVRHFLKGSEREIPHLVAYDSRCSYVLAASSGGHPRWAIATHGGQIRLPNGASIPPAPNAFNAATSEGKNFVVMSLPSIWRPVAPKSEIPLDWFLEGVLFHELAHSHQSAVTPGLSFPALQRERSLPDNVSDDTVQKSFEANPAYVRAYQAERDLLYRAASAPSDREAQALACEAHAMLRARRDRYLAGTNSLALVDELSLTTEGLGQWVAYAWLTSGRGLAPSLALQKLRGPFWSQDQGLALFLVVDRLVPGWQRLLFASSPATAERLLARACSR